MRLVPALVIEEAPRNPFADVVDPFEVADPAYEPGDGRHGHDLRLFRSAEPPKTKADKAQRLEQIRRQFPSPRFGEEEWRRIFRERPEIFRALCAELASADAATDRPPGQPGRWRHLSQAEASRRLLRMFGREYSLLPFAPAFKTLVGQRSVRSITTKTGIARARVHRLLAASIDPTSADMEQVAAAFGVHPSYFIEWRTAFVVAAIHDRLAGSPETSMSLYAKLVHG